jgi:hypothetical protein
MELSTLKLNFKYMQYSLKLLLVDFSFMCVNLNMPFSQYERAALTRR